MNNQTFSANSFLQIFDKENRKGNDIEKRFRNTFKETIELRNEIKKNINDGKYEKLDEMKIEREKCLHKKLEEISNTINQQGYSIEMKRKKFNNKYVYLLNDTPENFFISKRIQENLFDVYNIKQASRYEILNQLINIVEDNIPKIVIRTDITKFYESIPQKNLLKKLRMDNLLSIRTLKFIDSIFHSYNKLTNQCIDPKGVPRGVGISAYLSEIYMHEIDNNILNIPDLVYYARYVDDIVAIFIPEKFKENLETEYFKTLKDIIDISKLEVNFKKTKTYNIKNDLSQLNVDTNSIDFLGYKIGSKQINNRFKIIVEMSDNKLNNYKNKIKLAFEHFISKKKHNRKVAFKLLFARIKYLTSNTKLKSNKNKVSVGIYYSNPILSEDAESFNSLQNYLTNLININDFDDNEKALLNNCNFKSGFKDKTFIHTPLRKKIYKNYNCSDNTCNNKGILQFGISEIVSIWT